MTTKLLEEAFAAASGLSEDRQNAIAAMILEKIVSDRIASPPENGSATESPDSQIIEDIKAPGYPDPEISIYMARQAEIYERMKPKLLEQYCGMYIWLEDGRVIDADESEEALALRALAKTGPRHLFLKKVIPEEPQLSIRGFSTRNFSGRQS